MSEPTSIEQVDYDGISDRVRAFCAERLYELERSLRPMVDGSFGEVLPGHVNVYLAGLRDLARLYQAQQRPVALAQMIPAAKVQMLLQAQEAAFEERLRIELVRVEERVRMEVQGGQKLSIQAAQSTVLSRLAELESRGS